MVHGDDKQYSLFEHERGNTKNFVLVITLPLTAALRSVELMYPIDNM